MPFFERILLRKYCFDKILLERKNYEKNTFDRR